MSTDIVKRLKARAPVMHTTVSATADPGSPKGLRYRKNNKSCATERHTRVPRPKCDGRVHYPSLATRAAQRFRDSGFKDERFRDSGFEDEPIRDQR